MMKLNGWCRAGLLILMCSGVATSLLAQTFRTLANFDGTDGTYPEATLAQGTDGYLYGTAIWGGNFSCWAGCGTIFKITLQGEITTIYTFCSQPNCSDGAEPYGGLIQAMDGSFYGTTYAGGTGACSDGVIPGCGTVFRITSQGQLTTIYNLCSHADCSDGAEPLSALIQTPDGKLYGTTANGGEYGDGTIFEITAKDDFRTVYSFDLNEGATPASREALIGAPNGDLYGTTARAGASGEQFQGGTVFAIEPFGTFTTVYSFCTEANCRDGSDPLSGVIQAADGNFYGTTVSAGADGLGTVFEVTPDGNLTTLHNFCSQPNCTDGSLAYGRVIQATDGNIYGTTHSNGLYGAGTIYELAPRGGLTNLYSFCSQSGCVDGAFPFAGLLQATTGKFYGTTSSGGTDGEGAVFCLDLGFGPFVTFLRAAGKIGQTSGILGQGFTGTTSVTLSGIPANFTVVSDTFIKAIVPQGATTGYIAITTPSGVLKSNVPFQVIP